jgi:hypothetical protein
VKGKASVGGWVGKEDKTKKVGWGKEEKEIGL